MVSKHPKNKESIETPFIKQNINSISIRFKTKSDQNYKLNTNPNKHKHHQPTTRPSNNHSKQVTK